MNETFSQRLSRLRKEKNLTAAEMARLIDVAPTTYREWEYGRKTRLPPFLKISQVFAISVTELVTGTPSNPAPLVNELERIEEYLRQIRLALIAMK